MENSFLFDTPELSILAEKIKNQTKAFVEIFDKMVKQFGQEATVKAIGKETGWSNETTLEMVLEAKAALKKYEIERN